MRDVTEQLLRAGGGEAALRAGRGGRRAFTLLELIVALGMVAVIASSLYAAVRVAYRAQTSAEAAVEPARTAEVAFMMLRADIENAIPPSTGSVRLADVITGVNSSGQLGDADELTLYTTAPAPEREAANGEIKEVILTVGQPENSNIAEQCLLRKVDRNLLTTNSPVYQEQILARGVRSFNLRYWDGTDWMDDFEGTETQPMPQAVEVTLEFDRGADKPPLRYMRVFRVLCAPVTSTSGGQ